MASNMECAVARIRTLEEQRDKLLAALEAMVISVETGTPVMPDAIINARAAIRKAKGGDKET